MNTKNYSMALSLMLSLGITACGGGGSDSSDPVANVSPTPDAISSETPDPVSSSTPDPVTDPTPDSVALPATFSFASQIMEGESAVSYTGQTKRHLLIDNLNRDIAATVEDGTADPADILSETLNFYFDFDGTADGQEHEFVAGDGSLPVIPATYGAISSGKSLAGKIAGNDRPEHIVGGEFFGWETGLSDTPTPEELVRYFFDEFAAEATNGEVHFGSSKPYLSATGLDYKQLIQKFLLGSITFSQGTADYLQTDWSATNVNESDDPNDPEAYTAAEHNWDEAFGYFGAARDYNSAFTDDELASGALVDTNNDGSIDLRSEYSFGNSINCAKRDRAVADLTNPTNFTQEAFDAFIAGRQILNDAAANIGNDLTAQQLADLDVQIVIAAQTWEKCIAATVVHYINDLMDDMGEFTEGDFASVTNFENLAKHWGEMKGFALGLQFSPESPFRASDDTVMELRILLALMGDAPVLPDGTQGGVEFDGGTSAYIDDLLQARGILEDIYEFDSENVEAW